MMSRVILPLVAAAALAACQPAIPDSGSGIGFDSNFTAEQQRREAALAGVPAPAQVTSAPLGAAPDGSAEATAAQTTAVLNATRSGASTGVANDSFNTSGVAPLNASPSNPAPAVVNKAGISNENSFDAVSGQRSIESDAAKLAGNRAQYSVVQPQALPERSDSGPNVVAYALQTQNARGTQVFRRVGLNKRAKFERACAAFSSSNEAQIEFLARGGPQRDRQGMDPDGDGFACDWDPAPFRRAAAQG
jgi:hypothetical protein